MGEAAAMAATPRAAVAPPGDSRGAAGAVRRSAPRGAALAAIARAEEATEAVPAKAKRETLRIVSIKGDGRCMFRAIVQGLALVKGKKLFSSDEEKQADLLRMAVAETICASAERREKYPEALMAIKSEDTLPNYCQRVVQNTFWGGEAELLVISRMLKQPITVYMKSNKLGEGFRPIQEYGTSYAAKKATVKLLYNGSNHYELLVKRGRL